jgi:15-cis-phytoene synthase
MSASVAYRACRAVTRSQARNFSLGIRLLPGPERDAVSALYAFARRVDDIADGQLPADRKLAGLGAARAAVLEIAAGAQPAPPDAADPVLVALADATTRYPIPVDALLDLIAGAEMDVRGRTYPTGAELVDYCRHVAGSVGRMVVAVLNPSDPGRASVLADALGVALQLTNILRDIRDDHLNGRCYLPQEDLDRFGVRLAPHQGDELLSQAPGLVSVIQFEAERAERWFDEGSGLLTLLDRRGAACCATLAGVYYHLLLRIKRRPEQVLMSRVRVPRHKKAGVALRATAGRQW